VSDRYAPAGPRRDRMIAAGGVVLVHIAIGYVLVTGLAPALMAQAGEALQVFDVTLPPPPPPLRIPKPLPKVADPRRSGAAAPAGKQAVPKEIVAPTLPPPPDPPPILAAPIAGPGSAASAGAAPVTGPGTGGGGVGQGTGSGGFGTGQGGGGRGTFARKVSGRIYDRDYPRSAARAGIGGTVWVRYVVTVKGRAQDCRVTRSSGNVDLDAVTCRLVTKRFRYQPGTDAGGRPISSVVEEDHVWVIDDDEEEAP
jgi:protein TonB